MTFAVRGGFDRWQFRYDNAPAKRRRDVYGTGHRGRRGRARRCWPCATSSAPPSTQAWPVASRTPAGEGMADSSHVSITIESAERVVIDHGWTEMNQDVHTIAVQTLCQETGIDPAIVRVQWWTTASRQEAGMTTASQATSLVGNAIINAAATLREDLQTHALAGWPGAPMRGVDRGLDNQAGQRKERQGRHSLLLQLCHATGHAGRRRPDRHR